MSWTHRVAKVTTQHGVYYDMREYFPDLPNVPAWTDTMEPQWGA